MQKERLWELLIDFISEGILICDLHLNVLDINKNLEIMLDISDWRGKTVRDVFPWKVCFMIEKVINDIDVNDICLFPQAFNFVTEKGVLIPIMVLGEVIRDAQAEKVGYLFIFKDTILQEELNSLSWINALKTVYLSNIAKNLYKPMHNLDKILSDFVDFYRDELGDSLSMLEPAFNEMENLRNLYNDLLDYNRIDMTCDKFVLTEFSLEELVKGVISFLLPLENKDRIEIYVAGDTTILSDEFKLEQLMINFIDVIFKRVPEDKIRLDIIGTEKEIELGFIVPKGVLGDFVMSVKDTEENVSSWQKDRSLEENLMRCLISKLKAAIGIETISEQEIIRISLPREL